MNLDHGQCEVSQSDVNTFIVSLKLDSKSDSEINDKIPQTPNSDTREHECRSSVETPQKNALSNSSQSQDLPQYFEFIMDDSVSSEAFFVTGQDTPAPPCTNGTRQNTTDLSFLANEDSVSISDSHFIHFDHPEDNVSTSTCFSKSRQVPCDDSQESSSRTSTSPIFFDSKATLVHEDPTTAEESSMDSGLGSVDSTFGNSGGESASSSESAPSSPEEQRQKYDPDTSAENFYDCLEDDPDLNVRRKRQHEETTDVPECKKSRKQKSVQFCDVTVYYFPRKQSFVTVPSQGGSTLGMALEHVHYHVMSLEEHGEEIKQKHKLQVREHIREQKLDHKIKQLKFIHPDIDNATLTSMASRDLEPLESNESDTDDSILDNVDDYFFLQPIPTKKRRAILRMAGVTRIDSEEKLMNRITRQSRELCGCSCDGECMPNSCECALAGIQCQVDREAFPCSCLSTGCRNENGRVEFDSDRVRHHFETTMSRINNDSGGNTHILFSDDQGKETDSISSIESECELFSSDEVEHSEPNVQYVNDSSGTVNEFNEEASPKYAVITSDPPQRNMFIPVESGPHVQEDQECFLTEECIPDEFLNSLGLQKIDRRAFMTSLDGPPQSQVIPTLSAPESPSANLFSAATENLLRELQGNLSTESSFFVPNSVTCPGIYHPYRSSSENHNAYSHFDTSCTSKVPSMYGTTSSKKKGGAIPVTRECAVLLDPIATFMSAHNPQPDTVTHS